MTEEIHEHVGLYQGIADALQEVLPEDWASVKITCHMIWATARFENTYTTTSGEQVRFQSPPSLWDQFTELREATYAPNQGAWYTAELTLDREGNLEVNFDYDNKPNLPPAGDEDYLEDLARYPREPDAIPSWMPQRTN
ncbi:MAG TPA: immunity protein YezG family protein [Actinopolymorphaceae bacterium]|jgi:hypothetical protein